MTEIIYVLPNGERRVLSAEDGVSVMRAATDNGIPGIIGDCGGCRSCATCHVYIDPEFLPMVGEAGEFEGELLDGAACERRPNSRLSCQITVGPDIAGVIIHIPPAQL
jgi:2Fe-2S ferredoxin